MAFDPHPSADPERSYPANEAELRAFYQSREWRRLSYETKMEQGWQCQCCGKTSDDGVIIVTDHVRPARYYWDLRVDKSNLSVLCDECNKGKASWDQTDYRLSVKARLLDAVSRRMFGDRGEPLKRAIIAAHSYGALSQEDAIRLIRENGLVNI